MTRTLFALCVLTFSAATSDAYAAVPINCAKARSVTEKTICHTPKLLQADARTTAYFEIAIQYVAMGERGDLGDSQVAFPAKRDRCGARVACISNAYATQVKPLEAVIAHVAASGPF